MEAEAESASARSEEGEREEMEEEGQDERNREQEMQGAMGRGAPVFSLKLTVFSEGRMHNFSSETAWECCFYFPPFWELSGSWHVEDAGNAPVQPLRQYGSKDGPNGPTQTTNATHTQKAHDQMSNHPAGIHSPLSPLRLSYVG